MKSEDALAIKRIGNEPGFDAILRLARQMQLQFTKRAGDTNGNNVSALILTGKAGGLAEFLEKLEKTEAED